MQSYCYNAVRYTDLINLHCIFRGIQHYDICITDSVATANVTSLRSNLSSLRDQWGSCCSICILSMQCFVDRCVLVSFLFQPLHFLSFFDLRLLITTFGIFKLFLRVNLTQSTFHIVNNNIKLAHKQNKVHSKVQSKLYVKFWLTDASGNNSIPIQYEKKFTNV